MGLAPEQVAAAAGDAVTFRASPGRTFGVLAAALAAAYLTVAPAVTAALGRPGDPWWALAAQAALVAAVTAGGYTLTARAALRTWVRVSAAGLELAAQGSDPVLLAWPDVAAVAVRREGLRTVLDVVPVDLDDVHPVEAGRAGGPPLRDTPAGTAFTADLTHLWPPPAALRRELSRRLAAG